MPMSITDINGNATGVIGNPEYNNVANGQTNISAFPIAVTQVPKAAYQTMKTFTGVVTTSTGTVTITSLYTVTPGKTFYLTDAIFCNNSSNPSQVSVNASATAGVAPVVVGHALSTAPFDVTNIGTEPSVAGGTVVAVQMSATTAATAVTYFIGGYEQ